MAWVVALCSRLRGRVRVFYGIKWDADAAPYCPACDRPLSNYAKWDLSGFAFQCIACHRMITIRDEEGERVSYKEAKAAVLAARKR